MSSSSPPPTVIQKPKSNISEAELMDFAAALAITLPKNETLFKETVYIDDTGEPAEGYVGNALVEHCKEWTKFKTEQQILDYLQGLMYLRIILCAASQTNEQADWSSYQNAEEYLYGFDQSQINIFKCASRGSNFVDKQRWQKHSEQDDMEQELSKNSKINSKTISEQISIQISFKTGDTQTESTRMVKVHERLKEAKLTHAEIRKRREKMQEQQRKINESMKKKGKAQWKWKEEETRRKKEAAKQLKKEEEERKKKEAKMGGGGVVKYTHFTDEKEKEVENTDSSVKTDSYPIGSDNITSYEVGQVCSVWSQQKAEWVDGEVMEVIKFVKTIKIKVDGKTQQFRLPNVNMVRLKE
eukprot:CAMPEP_0197052574 /NCGR_PEP_ID=MMETSP1384-20130603/27032_1 /TAXON_ID=29189 /ORGANISM="Ammonia sp." /LENGTH=355 /DNA_ID=CAMNT_0042485337 /DNA_START=25 /DNA_END=1092 /DNA_ORIENTATION=-